MRAQRCRIVRIRRVKRVSQYHRLHKQMEIRVKSRNVGPKRAAEEHNEEGFSLIPTMGTLKLMSLLASGTTAALKLRCRIMRQQLGHQRLKTGPDSSAQPSLRYLCSASCCSKIITGLNWEQLVTSVLLSPRWPHPLRQGPVKSHPHLISLHPTDGLQMHPESCYDSSQNPSGVKSLHSPPETTFLKDSPAVFQD